MDKRQKQIVACLTMILLVVLVLSIAVIKKITPSKEVKDLNDYYQVGEGEALIFMENGQYSENALYVDNKLYIDYETVAKEINTRFYWDKYEKLLVYAMPTEVIKAEVDKNSYLAGKSINKTDYKVVIMKDGKPYIAMEFIKKYSNVEYEMHSNPNRVVISCHWGKEFQYAEADKPVSVRSNANIKYPIVAEVAKGDLLVYVDPNAGEENGFVKVMTADGVVGYVRSKYLMDSYMDKLKNDYKEPEYKNISQSETINMVWHQVTSASGATQVEGLLNKTKGVNVISPTWFSIKNNEGDIKNLASPLYVEKAHKQGVQVWALIDDFDPSLDREMLFGKTSTREKLSNTLIATAITNNIDGINIDFEKITAKSARAYLQFIRELSVKCRNNGIVLSIDNYVPASYNSFYNYKEQGIVADYVICMAYDEHYAGSEESGSVSSIPYVKKAVEDMVGEVPAEKVIMALPYYTRLWKETDGKVSSKALSMPDAAKLMQTNGVKLTWDDEIGQYYGEYKEGKTVCKMWLEDEKSYELKLDTVFAEKIAGISAWKLGLENPSVWNIVEKFTK